MKRKYLFIIIVFLTTVYAQPNKFNISIDTLDLCINGKLRKAVLFNDKLYCMFESDRINTSQSFKKLVVISKAGKIIEEILVPKEIQNEVHYNFEIENDSLFVYGEFYKNSFVLGKYVADFHQTKPRHFKIFQDSTYNIYSKCNGEWGGTIFFQNKKTKKVYEAASNCPVAINKIDNIYYVTNYMSHLLGYASVLEIPDPEKLENTELDFDKSQGSEFLKGVNTLYGSAGFDIYIATSFVVKKQLYHIYSDKNKTYIGIIEDGKLSPVYEFNFRFSAHLNQQYPNGQQVLSFYISNKESMGLLIINNSDLQFHFFN